MKIHLIKFRMMRENSEGQGKGSEGQENIIASILFYYSPYHAGNLDPETSSGGRREGDLG